MADTEHRQLREPLTQNEAALLQKLYFRAPDTQVCS